jgi:hypothetical protein
MLMIVAGGQLMATPRNSCDVANKLIMNELVTGESREYEVGGIKI